jgi:hypothetical protein
MSTHVLRRLSTGASRFAILNFSFPQAEVSVEASACVLWIEGPVSG